MHAQTQFNMCLCNKLLSIPIRAAKIDLHNDHSPPQSRTIKTYRHVS